MLLDTTVYLLCTCNVADVSICLLFIARLAQPSTVRQLQFIHRHHLTLPNIQICTSLCLAGYSNRNHCNRPTPSLL